MDLQQIKYFLAVVDNGTFLAAAEQVHVSQPTLSAGIRKLEQSLDSTLFIRGSRAAELTPAGHKFLPPARQAYQQLLTAKAQLKAEPEKLVIGVAENVQMDYVADIARVYRQAYPQRLLELVIDEKNKIGKKLAANKIDAAIIKNPAQQKGFTALMQEQLCIAVSQQHPFTQKHSLTVADLHQQPFIERVNCSFWQLLNQAFQQQSITPNTLMQVHSDEFVLSLVAADLGVSVITYRQTPYDVSLIPIADINLDSHIGLALGPQGSELGQSFISTITQHFGRS